MDVKDFYSLPMSRRKRYFELAKTLKEEKLKENMNVLSLVLSGELIFK